MTNRPTSRVEQPFWQTPATWPFLQINRYDPYCNSTVYSRLTSGRWR